MPTAVLKPPTTEEELRERAEGLAQDVEEQLEAPIDTTENEQRDQRIAARATFFDALRAAVLAVAKSSAWRAHDLARELLLLVEEFRDAITADPDAQDPQWRQREALQRMLVVLHAMIRQLEHDAIDRPEKAAQLVAKTLIDVEVSEVAR